MLNDELGVRVHLIEGCPGGSKTTQAINRIRQCAATVRDLRDIAALTFSRAGTATTQRRLEDAGVAVWKRTDEDSVGVRVSTIHSLCYHAGGDGQRVIDDKFIAAFCEANGIAEPRPELDEFGRFLFEGRKHGFFHAMDLARAFVLTQATPDFDQMCSLLHTATRAVNVSLTDDVVRRYALWWARWEAALDVALLVDFPRIVQRAELTENVRHLFVDEGQDLTPALWSVARRYIRPGGDLYIYRDQAQSLYAWNGALAGYVDKHLAGSMVSRVMLPNSYRVPHNIAAAAKAVYQHHGEGLNMAWDGTAVDGFAREVTPKQLLDPQRGILESYLEDQRLRDKAAEDQSRSMGRSRPLDRDHGTIIAAMDNYTMKKLLAHARSLGFIPTEVKGEKVQEEDRRPKEPYALAAQAVVDMHKSEFVLAAQLEVIKEFSSWAVTGDDFDSEVERDAPRSRFARWAGKPWWEVLDLLAPGIRLMLEARWQRNGSFINGTRICFETAYTTKGHEAPSVVFLATTSKGRHKELAASAEARAMVRPALYVGLTRSSRSILLGRDIGAVHDLPATVGAGRGLFHGY